MQKPSFSIIVPTYERRDVVSDALRSLNQVSYDGHLEIVVVVDGSSDGSVSALHAIGSPFPFQVIFQQNAGAASARNRGAAAASGEILLFLDDDMMCAADMVEHHARNYLDGADAVLGDIPLDDKSVPGFLSIAVGRWTRERSERLAAGGDLTLFDLLTGQLSIRRTVFEAVGGFDGKFTLGGSFGNEDLDIGTRLLKNYDVRFESQAVSHQRYVVGYQQNMVQWYQAGQADVSFARKHPARAAELFELHGLSKTLTRLILIPLSRIPGLPRAVSQFASRFAERYWGKVGPLNRYIARLFFLVRDAFYWAGVHSAGGIPGPHPILVLCYHAIQDLSRFPTLKPYGTPALQFEAQLVSLIQRGAQFITPDELENYVAGGGGVPRNAVLLTFDDCYAELAGVTRSILQTRNIPALAFAVSGVPSRTNEWDQKIGFPRLGLLSPAELIELQDAGVEIGCHSKTHPELPKVSPQQLEVETIGAAQELASHGIRAPRYFAYPYGESNAATRTAIRAAGFSAAFGLRRQKVTRKSNPLDLPRVEILDTDGGWKFWLKTSFPRLSRAFL